MATRQTQQKPDTRESVRLTASAAPYETMDVVLTMTLVFLFLHGGSEWYTLTLSSSLCLCAFLHPPLKHRPSFWLFLGTAQMFWVIYFDWPKSNNHEFLIAYWCLAIGLSLHATDVEQCLGFNGRLLTGLTFLFAAFWKAITWDYVDGSTFEFLLVGDQRFYPLPMLLGAFTGEMASENIRNLERVQGFAPRISLVGSPQIDSLALFLTYWTLLIEAVIAILFLWPLRGYKQQWRHIVLIGFLASTYPLLPVLGFGWLFIIMSLAQCPQSWRRIRFAYMVLFVALFIFKRDDLKLFLVRLWLN